MKIEANPPPYPLGDEKESVGAIRLSSARPTRPAASRATAQSHRCLPVLGARALTAASESRRSLMLRMQFGVERSRPECSALAAEPCKLSRDAPTTGPNGEAPTERR